MQFDHFRIQQFLALSDLYFRLTSKTSSVVSSGEIEEFFEIINDCSPPLTSPEQYLT